MATKTTIEQYEAAIPECCAYQIIDEHENIMLCWGLLRAVEEGREMGCGGCGENVMVDNFNPSLIKY